MNALYKLPNGDYVDPACVTRIVFHAQEPGSSAPGEFMIPARVVVWSGDGHSHVCYARDDADAYDVRKMLGAEINSLRTKDAVKVT